MDARFLAFSMRLFLLAGMLVWPGWASVAGNARWVDAAAAPGAVLVIGLASLWLFTNRVWDLAVTGLAGGLVGVPIGLFYGIVWGYWVGAGMSVGFVVACATLLMFCQRLAPGDRASMDPENGTEAADDARAEAVRVAT